MKPNYDGGCFAGPCPPDDTTNNATMYKALAYTILAFLTICVVSYITGA